MDKVGAPYYFHTVVGGGHNPYFGLKFDSTGKSSNSSGGGIGLFEDPMVEPLIRAFFRHYLLDGRKDLFTGPSRSGGPGMRRHPAIEPRNTDGASVLSPK